MILLLNLHGKLSGFKQSDMLVEIDPGMAFGTGTHETTKLCIKSLQRSILKG